MLNKSMKGFKTMTITKKHLTDIANIIATCQQFSDDKNNEEYEAFMVLLKTELKHFCIKHCDRFDAHKFDTHIFLKLEEMSIQREKRRIKKFEEAQKMLNQSQFGIISQ